MFCRLCRNIISCANSEAIEKVTREILKGVLHSLILEEGRTHLMCKSCCPKLVAAFNFKSACMGTEDIIYSYVNSSKVTLVDLKEVYLKMKANIQLTDIRENQRICRLCIQPIHEFVSVNEVDNDIIEACIPQVNFSVTKDPVICGPCFDSLYTQGGFIRTCIEAQEKYNSAAKQPYLKTEGREIKLEDSRYENEYKFEKIEIKSEKGDQDDDTPLHNLYKEIIDNGKMEISQDIEETKYEYMLDPLYTKGGFVKNCLELKGKLKSIDRQPYIKTEEVEIKVEDGYDVQDQDDDSSVHNMDVEIIENGNKQISEHIEKTKCEYMIKCETEMQMKQYESMLDILSYENRHKRKFKGGLKYQIAQKLRYKCDECIYKCKSNGALKRHQLIHKDPSEIKMYKCDACTYATKYKSHLRVHQLLHKNPSEIQMHKCGMCTYETKSRGHLKSHLLIHKDPSEIQMYRCDACDFEAKRKSELNNHQLLHKDPSEIQMYMCATCTYETRFKQYLKVHLLTHRDPSEIQMYMCDKCNYRSKRRFELKRHQLTHRDPSEIPLYMCDTCGYETKHKRRLKSHQLLHKHAFEIQMCDTYSDL